MSSSFVSKHVQCSLSGHLLLKGLQSCVKDVSEAILFCSSENGWKNTTLHFLLVVALLLNLIGSMTVSELNYSQTLLM